MVVGSSPTRPTNTGEQVMYYIPEEHREKYNEMVKNYTIELFSIVTNEKEMRELSKRLSILENKISTHRARAEQAQYNLTVYIREICSGSSNWESK